MKKTPLLLLLTLFFITACGSSKVCGGPGGKRCVETKSKTTLDKIS